MPHRAITMGVETILISRRCLLLATGAGKAEIMAQAIEGPMTSMISASALQLHPHCNVLMDEAAAGRLTKADCYKTTYHTDFSDESIRLSSSATIGTC
jgi:glucosamine-6-phosphate deaminase